jgi:hypothetical protein
VIVTVSISKTVVLDGVALLVNDGTVVGLADSAVCEAWMLSDSGRIEKLVLE